jgi:hypothetical protein
MERSLHVINNGPDAPLAGVCTACNRRFMVPHTPGEDPIHKLTREFNEHDCNEDASQPSAWPGADFSSGLNEPADTGRNQAIKLIENTPGDPPR